jgi:uncharacterized protein (TIGR02271 family)
MIKQTIVAVYDKEADAAAAVNELENAGIPSTDIFRHAQDRTISGSTTTPIHKREPGFWARLFGATPEREYDTSVYDRSLERGSNVVSVKVEEQYVNQAGDILERYNPIDIDERGSSYASGAAPRDMATSGLGRETEPLGTESVPSQSSTSGASKTSLTANGDQTMELAEEKLAVGKHAINRGTTRVRRYVVETPVEEPVRLRSESVSVERRAVNDRRPVSDAEFTDKVVEMSETDEEPVISKTAQVKEELVIHKEADERTETVRDKVRREEAEVTRENGDAAIERVADQNAAKPRDERQG